MCCEGHERKIARVRQYTVGPSVGVSDAGTNYALLVLPPPFRPGCGDDEMTLVIPMISATLNDDSASVSLPSQDAQAGLRVFALPKVAADRYETATRSKALYDQAVRETGRTPLLGWYQGDAGTREVLDTNFGVGHEIDRDDGGFFDRLVIATKVPATQTADFSVRVRWELRKTPGVSWV